MTPSPICKRNPQHNSHRQLTPHFMCLLQSGSENGQRLVSPGWTVGKSRPVQLPFASSKWSRRHDFSFSAGKDRRNYENSTGPMNTVPCLRHRENANLQQVRGTPRGATKLGRARNLLNKLVALGWMIRANRRSSWKTAG
jgi:hypothetical protein